MRAPARKGNKAAARRGRDANAPWRPGQDSRARIVKAAIRLFGERGYDRTTVRAICEVADANPGLVPYYFAEGKEELWRAAAEESIGQYVAELTLVLTRMEHAPLQVRLETVLRTLVTAAAKYPELHRFVQTAADGSNADRHDWMVERYSRPSSAGLCELFEEGRAVGLLPDVDVPTFMYMAVGAATLPYMLHRDVEKVQGVDVFDDDAVRRHADAMIATFLRRIEND